MPFTDGATHLALVCSQSFAVARQPVGLIVQRVAAFRTESDAPAFPDYSAFSLLGAETSNGSG